SHHIRHVILSRQMLRHLFFFHRYKNDPVTVNFILYIISTVPMLHNFHTYTFDQQQSSNFTIPDEIAESNADVSDTALSHSSLEPSSIPQWRPTTHLHKRHTRFVHSILYQHPCITCAYCGKLMYPKKVQWK